MSAYRDSLKRYTEVLRDALELADDPYKAPELTVQVSASVVRAAWDLQVQYAALAANREMAASECSPQSPLS